MATVTWWEAAWYQDIPGNGGRIGLVLTGFGGGGTAVNVTAYPVGQGNPVTAVENVRTTWDAFFFDIVNVGPADSVCEGTNLSFAWVRQ